MDYFTAYQQLEATQLRAQNGVPDLPNPASTVTIQLPTDPQGGLSGGLNGMSLPTLVFPFDYPPHQIVFIECDVSPLTGSLSNFQRVYRLPMPTVLEDEHSTIYDHNFNFMSLFGAAAGMAAGAIQNPIARTGAELFLGALGTAGQALKAATGLSLNTFKVVTMAVPNFRQFQMEWRLFPKTYAESEMLARMALALKTAMAPTLEGGGFLYGFPRVFLPYFNTGSQFLYKFKPCVLQGFNVNYQGGAPYQAFYKDGSNWPPRAIPEGIVFRASFLELELWTRESHTAGTTQNGLPSPDPFSGVRGFSVNNGPTGLNPDGTVPQVQPPTGF